MIQARIPGAEIIEHNPYSGSPQRPHDIPRIVEIGDQRALGNFQFEPEGCHPRVFQRGQHQVVQTAVFQLTGENIQANVTSSGQRAAAMHE